jgi:hypothetical protein
MDYSDDNCLYEFTENQVNRMQAQFGLYRSELRQDITLMNGVTSDPTDMRRYEFQTYVLAAPVGARVECASSSEGGDIDLYMRDGEPPVLSTNSLDCFGESGNSNEACSILANTGFAYVSIYGFKRTDGAVVTCTTSELETATEITSGISSEPFDVRPNEEKVFTLLIEDPNARVACFLESNNPSEDTNVFLRFNQPPDFNTNNYDCQSSGSEICSVANPGDAAVLWATVTSSSLVNDLSFACFSTVPDPEIMLSPNVRTDLISLDAFEEQSFLLLPAPGASVTCQVATGSTGSGNMFLRWSSEPDLSSGTYDCSVFDLTRSCTVTDPGLATPKLYVTIETFGAGLDNLELECSVDFPSISLQDGVATEPFDLFDSASETFDVQISRGDNITCLLTADNPEVDSVDLFVSSLLGQQLDTRERSITTTSKTDFSFFFQAKI